MHHVITSVQGVAKKQGIQVGDALLSINGEPVLDEIDYQALSIERNPTVCVYREDKIHTIHIHKDDGEPLGLHFDQSMALSPRVCKNRCDFCFIDQLPKGMRPSLYVKDDDWRYSLMMGNFVTFTNITEEEFQRIIKRKASPLYISVHATDPAVRTSMMRCRQAGDILSKLRRLTEADISFHAQIVVCPNHNDGAVLTRTITDLMSLAPYAKSMALVPVGLTKFRKNLAPLTPFTQESAQALLEQIAPFQEKCKKQLGTTFIFPSDEFFCIAKAPIPPNSWYEDYVQIENGVGQLRQLETEMEEEKKWDDELPPTKPLRLLIPTGTSVAPHLKRICERFEPSNVSTKVVAVVNRFFGDTVTVAGLLTGGDVLQEVKNEMAENYDAVLITENMLRHEGDLFLDNMSLDDFKKQCGVPVYVIGRNGAILYHALQGRFDWEG